MADITLQQASERALQADVVLALMIHYPNQFENFEVAALSNLLQNLVGSVASYLTEKEVQENANG